MKPYAYKRALYKALTPSPLYERFHRSQFGRPTSPTDMNNNLAKVIRPFQPKNPFPSINILKYDTLQTEKPNDDVTQRRRFSENDTVFMCIYKTNNISFFTFDKCLQSLRNMFIKDYGKEIKYPMFSQDKRMKGFS